MKKTCFILLLLVVSYSAIYAQGLRPSWFGVRGSVNFSNLSSPDYSTDFLTGFTLGGAYCHSLAKGIPIYIESGLYFQKRGARDNGFLVDGVRESKFIRYELAVPLLIGVEVPMTAPWSIHAITGLCYSFATNGKFEIGDEMFNPYKKELLQTLRDAKPTQQQLLHRSNIAIRVGVSVLYDRYLFGIAYDAGLTNLYTRHLRDQGYEAQSGSFTMQLGCDF